MASQSADHKGALTSFRFAVTCLSASATLAVIVEWLDTHPFQNNSFRGQPTIIRYALQESSSPRILICLALIVLLCAVQITLIWRSRLTRYWLAPIVTEFGLASAFAIAVHQIFGSSLIFCGSDSASCRTMWPRLLQGSDWEVFAIIGVALGLLWSFSGRRGQSLSVA